MPLTLLEHDADFNQVCQWLGASIISDSIIPETDNLSLLTENKSIHLWFMSKECYPVLSEYVLISSLNNEYSRVIAGKVYDLVYVEDRWFRSGMENDPLKQRTEYHIAQTAESDGVDLLKSTLRASLACLVSDDMAALNATEDVNTILRKYFIVYKVSYTELAVSAKHTVSDQAKIIVEKLNPLFNVRNGTELEQLPETYALLNERRLTAAMNAIDSLTREKKEAIASGVEIMDFLSKYNQMKQAIYYWQGIQE